MALPALAAGISAGKGALDITKQVADGYNAICGSGTGNIWNKYRALQITVVNLDPNSQLLMANSWFDTGRFWQQPMWSIPPGESMTFYVCNRDSAFMHGVSGGCSFGVYPGGKLLIPKPTSCSLCGCFSKPSSEDFELTDPSSREPTDGFICCFSNPFFGIIKGRCQTDSDFSVDRIKAVWGGMRNGDVIRSDKCGFYVGNLPGKSQPDHAYGDRKMVFIWKTAETKW